MPPPQLSVDEYVAKVKMSNQPTLLVEGKTDAQAFVILLDSIKLARQMERLDLVIDNAALISSESSNMGNREKVEAAANAITPREFSSRFVGFVDREFREFITNDTLGDNLRRHNQIGRLVWSRGHSIENYFFEFDLIREPMRGLSDSIHFGPALDRMKESFQDVMNIACAISLAAKDIARLNIAERIVHWSCFNSSDSSLTMDSELWIKHLSSRLNLDNEHIDRLIERFEHWLRVSRNSGPEVVRWLCHGHIGNSVIWNAYEKFFREAISSSASDDTQNQNPNVYGGSGSSLRFNQCASELAHQSVSNNAVEAPSLCFNLLGIAV